YDFHQLRARPPRTVTRAAEPGTGLAPICEDHALGKPDTRKRTLTWGGVAMTHATQEAPAKPAVGHPSARFTSLIHIRSAERPAGEHTHGPPARRERLCVHEAQLSVIGNQPSARDC